MIKLPKQFLEILTNFFEKSSILSRFVHLLKLFLYSLLSQQIGEFLIFQRVQILLQRRGPLKTTFVIRFFWIMGNSCLQSSDLSFHVFSKISLKALLTIELHRTDQTESTSTDVSVSQIYFLAHATYHYE